MLFFWSDSIDLQLFLDFGLTELELSHLENGEVIRFLIKTWLSWMLIRDIGFRYSDMKIRMVSALLSNVLILFRELTRNGQFSV